MSYDEVMYLFVATEDTCNMATVKQWAVLVLFIQLGYM